VKTINAAPPTTDNAVTLRTDATAPSVAVLRHDRVVLQQLIEDMYGGLRIISADTRAQRARA
jgi:hypothetical protein